MPKPIHAGRHATALKIAAALGRAERACHDPHAKVALLELHQVLADAVVEHGPELGLAKVDQYSSGLPK